MCGTPWPRPRTTLPGASVAPSHVSEGEVPRPDLGRVPEAELQRAQGKTSSAQTSSFYDLVLSLINLLTESIPGEAKLPLVLLSCGVMQMTHIHAA